MDKIEDRTISSQIFGGIIKFLAIAVSVFVIIAIIIPFFLEIIGGKDMPPVDDSRLGLQTVSLPEEENAFYDLDKVRNVINVQNVPEGKQLVSGYLDSDKWNQEDVSRLLADNDEALQYFDFAALKGKFQLPYTSDPSEISRDIPVTPLNDWREISRISGIKAIWLAKSGQYEEAITESFKPIIIGNAIENSQSLLITYLVGISMKDTGLDTLRKVISMIPENSQVLSKYRLELENYEAKGNSAPFSIEYMVWKQSINDYIKYRYPNSRWMTRFLADNKFYFKKNLTFSYYFDLYSRLAVGAENDCSSLEDIESPIEYVRGDNIIKMYFTENLVGKRLAEIPVMALNNILAKKCATERKLEETISLIKNR